MAELEDDIRTWTDRAVAGVEPVTAEEAMASELAYRAGRPRRAAVTVCVALLITAAIVAFLMHDPADTTTVTSAPGSSVPTSATVPSPGETTTVTSPSSTTASEPAPPPTSPSPHTSVNVAGTYEGTSVYALWTENCTVDGIVDLEFTLESGEHWQFHNPNCGEIDSDNVYTGHGTFVLTTPDGATIVGSQYTRVPLEDNGGPISLTITGGTGHYEGAAGSCTMHNRLVQPSIGKQFHSGTFACEISTPDTAGSTTTTSTSTTSTTVADV
jgi:hypothetical protein